MTKKPEPTFPASSLLAIGALAASVFSTNLAVAQPDPVLNFDGIESIIQTDLHPEDLGIQGASPKTVEAWVYTRSFTQGGVFHVGTSSGGEEFALRTHGLNDRWMAQFWGGPDQEFTVLGSNENWTHIALTYDGSTIRVYADGEEVVSAEENLNTQGDEWPFRIGAWRDQHFHGAIRDVRIWDVARSQSEIQATMSDTSSLPAANLVAWWPLDEGEGRVAGDASGNNHDADIFAAQWEGQQFEYDPDLEADFSLDFGTGTGQVDESDLLRNRPDHFSLQDEALRMTNTTGNAISSSAAASVANRESGRNFVLESEVELISFPDIRNSRIGLVLLGGPHVPLDDPFDTADDEGFYTVSFYPALPSDATSSLFPLIETDGDDTAVMYIAEGFDGPYLAAARWDGRKPFPRETVAAIEDDFQDPGTDAEWLTGGDQDSWEIGEPTYPDDLDPVEGSTRVAATNLDDTLSTNSNDWIRSPVIDLTEAASAVLSFREAIWIDDFVDPDTDERAHVATVSVVDENGDSIAVVDQYWGNSNGWRDRTLTLPDEAIGQNVRVEFHLLTDDWVEDDFYGWQIDGFSVVGMGEPDLGTYALRAEGGYGYAGELELTFTLTDLDDTENHSQSLSATIDDPLDGNLFGLGGRMESTPDGDPEFDFRNLSMTQGEQPPLVPTTTESAFYYPFGTMTGRVAPDNFLLVAEDDWILRGESLELSTDRASGNSAGVTRVREFEPGNTIRVESDIVLSSLDAAAGGNIGLVLFGEESPSVFDADDASTYYTFQYIFDGNGDSRIALREGTSGAILSETSFDAPTAGATYRFEFTGESADDGPLEFVATLSDDLGGQASLSGELTAPLEGRNRFGFAAEQGGGDVWDVLNFGGYTISEKDVNFPLYRWTPLQTRGSGNIQMSVFTFYLEGTDVLEARRQAEEPMPTVTGSTPFDNEPPQNLVDGDTETKWFGSDNTEPLLFAFDEPVAIDAYMMWTANDAPDRDPLSWRLEGSHDGFAWELLDTVQEFPTPTDRFTRFMDTGEFDLPTGAVLNDFNVGGVENATFRVVRNGEPFTLAWNTSFATSVNIQPDIGQVSATGSIEVLAPENEETAYTLTAVGNDGVPHTATVTVRSVAATTHDYRYVRFDLPDEDARRGAGNSIQITQFQFFLGEDEVSPAEVSNPGGNPPDNEPVSNLLVPSGKWLDFNMATRRDGFVEGSRVIFDFGEEVSIDGYRFVTGNDAPERDPVRWRLWGRNGTDEDWTLIEHMSEPYPVPLPRITETQIFPLVSDPDPSPGVIDRFGIDRLGGEAVDPTLLAIVRDGTTVGLTWEAIGTSDPSIDPGPGAVDRAGSEDLLPPQTATSTMTFSAPGDGGTGTASVWIRSVPEDHFESVRYVRFDIADASALRDPNAGSIQLSRFFFFRNEDRVDAVSVTNPGGDNPSTEPAGNLTGDTDAKWFDGNAAHENDSHLVFDFGEVVEIDAYQIGTANDEPGRDPLRWRLYGRVSEEDEWEMIENMPVDYPVPTDRHALTSIIPLPGDALAVPVGPSFDDWRQAHFQDGDETDDSISGPLAAPANDGVANLLKYAFGLDPWTPASGADLPQAEVVGDTLTLTYLERIGATDIDYLPQKSFTLDNWDGEGIQEVSPRVPTEDGEFEWVTVELELNGESKAFLRVQVLGEE